MRDATAIVEEELKPTETVLDQVIPDDESFDPSQSGPIDAQSVSADITETTQLLEQAQEAEPFTSDDPLGRRMLQTKQYRSYDEIGYKLLGERWRLDDVLLPSTEVFSQGRLHTIYALIRTVLLAFAGVALLSFTGIPVTATASGALIGASALLGTVGYTLWRRWIKAVPRYADTGQHSTPLDAVWPTPWSNAAIGTAVAPWLLYRALASQADVLAFYTTHWFSLLLAGLIVLVGAPVGYRIRQWPGAIAGGAALLGLAVYFAVGHTYASTVWMANLLGPQYGTPLDYVLLVLLPLLGVTASALATTALTTRVRQESAGLFTVAGGLLLQAVFISAVLVAAVVGVSAFGSPDLQIVSAAAATEAVLITAAIAVIGTRILP